MIAFSIFILSAFLVATKADILDFATLYRFSKDNDSLTVTKEYHRQNNALGMLLQQDGEYIDSVNGMIPFGCVIASAKCIWNKEGEWSLKNTTSLNDLNYTIPVQDGGGSCNINNGGCQVFCTMQNSKPVCNCPEYFSLSRNGKDCYPVNSASKMFTNLTGKFAFSNSHPSRILIVAPPNATIELNYTSFGYGFYIIEYYPSGISRSYIQYSHTVKYRSTSEIVYIRADNYGSNSGEYEIVQWRPTLTLESAAGALRLAVPSLAPALCVSVIYRPAAPGDGVRMAATLPDASVVDFADSHTKKIGSWLNSRFEVTLPEYETNSPVLLSVLVSGAGTVLHSIAGCSPHGKVDITIVGTVPMAYVPSVGTSGDSSKTNKEAEGRCYNGGEYIEDDEQCNCPSGFMGPRCEEGCGPNRYGSDCGATCSPFAAACSGIVFCKDRLPCLCAPGYRGQNCNLSCSAGFYGASCQNSCGKCSSGTCNQFTGMCEDGCLPGYAPPLCQDTHKYIGSGLAIVNNEFTLATIQADVSEAKGRGDVIFYQLQYKEQGYWLEMQPEKMSGSVISTNLTGLNAGHTYEVRIVLIDEDGSSYDGEKVAIAKFTTPCKVPASREYDMKISETTDVSCIVSWKYEDIENECPVSGYEVILEKNWQRMKSTVPPGTNSFEFSGLLSGETYSVSVQALSQRGRAPASAALAVTTQSSAPGLVTNLVVSRSGVSGLEVAWKKPRYTAGEIQDYVVEYECVRLLACPEDPCELRKVRSWGPWAAQKRPCEDPCHSSRSAVAVAAPGPPRAALTGLLAHARYRVAVRARAAQLGPAAIAYATTQDSGPSAPPQPEDPPEAGASATNTSVSVRWQPLNECALLGGYLRGYRLELRLAGAGAAEPPLRVATTPAASATLDGLQPQTEYSVRVFAETSGGWSPQQGLEIVAKTAATAPEAVRHLEVYKRGRRTLGLRWAAPHRSYGPIRSFSLSLSREGPQEETQLLAASVDASSRCDAWPEMFCQTLQGPPLAPSQRYRVTVRARNQLVEAEGLPATVAAETREQTPGRPEALAASPRGPRAVLLRWQPPSLFNGLLRSFLLTVEQTDTLEPASCCADFPVRELPVRAEQPAYEFEVTELSPAASYVFSVSAKTLAIGPGASVALSTGPEPPVLQPPQLNETGSASALLTLEPAAIAPAAALDGGYILLVVPTEAEEAEDYLGDEGEPEKAGDVEPRRGVVLSPQLAEQLAGQLAEQLADAPANASFYVAREFPLGELPAEVRVGSGARQAPGLLASPWDPPLAPAAEHRVALALVLRYRGAASVAVAVGEPFATDG